MKRINIRCVAMMLLLATNGCASVFTNKADLAKTPNGIRAYSPRVMLFVGQNKHSYIRVVPNVRDAYDIKPFSFLAKQNFNIQMEDGILKQADLNEDTTSIIPLIQKGAELAAQAGKGINDQIIDDDFGLKPGVYEWQADGALHHLSVTDLAGQ